MISKSFVASQTSFSSNARVRYLIKSVRERTIQEYKSNNNIQFYQKHLFALISKHLMLNNVVWNIWVYLHKFLK